MAQGGGKTIRGPQGVTGPPGTSGSTGPQGPTGPALGGIITQRLDPEGAQFMPTGFPQFTKNIGTNMPMTALAYIETGVQAAFWKMDTFLYHTGTINANIYWYAATGVTGAVSWGIAMNAVTPQTDTDNVENKVFAGESTGASAHLGTTNKRLHKLTVPITQTDSLANQDISWVRIRRLADATEDTLIGDVYLERVILQFVD